MPGLIFMDDLNRIEQTVLWEYNENNCTNKVKKGLIKPSISLYTNFWKILR